MGVADNPANGPHARQPPEFLAVGRVVRPHGLRGELLVQGISDLISSVTTSTTVYLGNDRVPTVVRGSRPHSKRFLLMLEGCEDRDTAELLRGEVIHIRYKEVEPLPKHVYYHWQILDMQVHTTDGEYLGKVIQIIETGANDVYLVQNEDGVDLLLPAIESVIMEVDLDKHRIVVDLLPGLRSESPD